LQGQPKQLLLQINPLCAKKVTPRPNVKVNTGRKLFANQSKGFANEPFGAVALDCSTKLPTCRDSQPCKADLIVGRIHYQVPAYMSSLTGAHETPKLSALQKAYRLRKTRRRAFFGRRVGAD
jgi:hypothetical protein